MNFCKHISFLFTISVLLFSAQISAQFVIPPKLGKKSEQKAVYDGAQIFTSSQRVSLEKKLIDYADSTSTQIVIATVNDLNGDDISMVGAKWAQEWGVGQAEKDNGIFILLSKNDREVDINTGYGIEYILTDRMAERIINRVMIPKFKENKYYQGLDQEADAIFQVLKGEYEETRNFDGVSMQQILIILFIFFIVMLILRRRNKGNGNNNGGRGGGSLLDVIILSNMGRTGGFGSGTGSFGGGGGFSGGFGGGGFGGGGASGSW